MSLITLQEVGIFAFAVASGGGLWPLTGTEKEATWQPHIQPYVLFIFAGTLHCVPLVQ